MKVPYDIKKERGVKILGVQLIRGEQVVWKSFPGKNYRMFIFFRDMMLTIIISMLVYKSSESFLNFLPQKVVTYTSVGIGLVGLLYCLITQINFLLVRYFITNERILIQRGLISRHLTSVKFENINDVKVEQSISDRMLKIGTIYFFTANDSGSPMNDSNPLYSIPAFKTIDNPFQIHAIVEEQLEEQKEKKLEKSNPKQKKQSSRYDDIEDDFDF